MKIKTVSIIFATLFVFSATSFSQNFGDRLDFRVGAGVSLQGTGDMTMLNYENELNCTMNRYFTLAGSVNFGRSINGVFGDGSSSQGNIMLFFSPFKNTRRFDFRFGPGLGFQKYSYSYQEWARYENGVLVDERFSVNKVRSFGPSLTFEGTYMLNDLYMLGAKIYTKPFFDDNIDSGIMIKFGRRL